MATAWEDLKRTGQSAFANIGDSYQQILITGHLYPPTDRDQLNREIAEAAYDQPEQGELFYLDHFHGHKPNEPEPKPDLEPER